MQSVFHTERTCEKISFLKSCSFIFIEVKTYNTSSDIYSNFQFCASFHIYLKSQTKPVIYKHHSLKTVVS